MRIYVFIKRKWIAGKVTTLEIICKFVQGLFNENENIKFALDFLSSKQIQKTKENPVIKDDIFMYTSTW